MKCLVACAIFVVLATAMVRAQGEPCNPDLNFGFVEIRCNGFKKCENGKAVNYNCGGDKLFDKAKKSCMPASSVKSGCGKTVDCSSKSNGMYANAGCETFHVCHTNTFYGQFYCPFGTKFNDAKHFCDHPGAVSCKA